MTKSYIVYTMPNCPDCKNSKDLLTRKGLSFVEVTEFSPQELIDKVGPIRTLPQILMVDAGDHDHAGAVYHVGGYKDLTDHLLTGAKVLRKLD